MADPKHRPAPEVPDLPLPTSAGASAKVRALPPEPRAIDDDADDDDGLGMEIERGGALTSLVQPSTSRRRAGPASSQRASSGLELAHRRADLQRGETVVAEPSRAQRLLAYALTVVSCAGVAALSFELGHRRGGRSILGLLPRAFDASSTIESATVAIFALAAAIGLGVIGVRARPRSYAMIGSASMLLVASVAMVTVTLVSTEESSTPPDGALVIPYIVPLALALLGLGIAGRGVEPFLRGGARRVAPIVAGAVGGALLFAAIELGALASRLP